MDVSKSETSGPRFFGLDMIVKCVIRNTDEKFPDISRSERYQKIMVLLLGPEWDKKEHGGQKLEPNVFQMDEVEIFLSVLSDINAAEKEGKNLPIKHALEKYINRLPARTIEQESTIRHWRKKYNEFLEWSDYKALLAQEKMISPSLFMEIYRGSRNAACSHFISDMSSIRKLLKAQGWPF